MYYCFNLLLFNLLMLLLSNIALCKLTIQLSIGKPLHEYYLHTFPCDLLSTFKVLMALSPVSKQIAKMTKCRAVQTSLRRSSSTIRLPRTSSTRQPVGLVGWLPRVFGVGALELFAASCKSLLVLLALSGRPLVPSLTIRSRLLLGLICLLLLCLTSWL